MILRMLILMSAVFCSLTPVLSAGCDRGDRILSEIGTLRSTDGTGAALLGFADFYAVMPGDNTTTIAGGTPVLFPNDGPTSGLGIVRTGFGTFNLMAIGVYQVLFQVSVDEPGQLVLNLNGVELAPTVVGRATGTSQIVGMALVQTSVPNSILSVNNPTGNSPALTITPVAGGTHDVSAHLVITRIQ